MNDKLPSEYSNEELVEEIKKEKDLLGRMVGTLYPSIVATRIGMLDEECRKRIAILNNIFKEIRLP